MGGQHRARARPVPGQDGAVRVELLGRDRRTPRLPAHLGGRQQWREPVEGPVLKGLGAQSRRGLGEPGGEGRIPQQQLPYAGHRGRTGQLGRPLQRLRRQLRLAGVGPVDGKRDQQLAYRAGKFPAGPALQRPQLGGQVAGQHLPRAGPGGLRPLRQAGGPPVPVRQFRGALGIGEHPVDPVQRVVPGGPRHRPAGRQPLVAGQDLLDHHPAVVAGGGAQPAQVLLRVGQPVHVVDPQPLCDPVPDQLQHLRVGGREHVRVLHPDPDQLRNGEETTVVEHGRGLPPPGRPVPLGGQQLRQRQALGALPQRELLLPVAQHPAVDPQVAGVRRPGEQREHHLPAAGLPVDVEPACVRRVGPVPQHLPQRPVQPQRRRHRHVVGHDVEDQAEPVLPGGAGQGPQAGLPAQLGPYARVVGDVVPVGRSGHRLQDGGEVQVRHAERGEVRHGRLGRREGEFRAQLETVRRSRGDGFRNIRFRCGGRARLAHENVRTQPAGFRAMTQCIRVTAPG